MKKIVLPFFFFSCLAMTGFAQRNMNPKLTALRDEKDSLIVQKKLVELGESENEEDLGVVIQYYNMKSNGPKADSVFRLTVKKFPKGKYAFINAGNNLIEEKDSKEKEKLYENLVKDFPGEDYSMQQYSVADQFGEDGNSKKMMQYADLISDKGFQAMARELLARQQLKKGNIDLAELLIKKAMDSAKKAMEKLDTSKGVTRNGQMNQRGNPKTAYYNYANTYSQILLKKGKLVEAYQWAKEAYDNSNKKNLDINGQYLNMLLATNRMAEAFPMMEAAIKEGRASEEIKNRLEDAYKASKGTVEGYEIYAAALDKEFRDKIRGEVAKMILKKPAVMFTLKDVNGKSVSLQDYKGKIVVLDFWATWCGPCKKSFPAMQMAVTKYKNDPNVKFLFIHTWERGKIDPAIDAKKYVKDNHYSFEVLVDRKDPNTLVNKVVTDYGIDGIPAKFVVDGNGYIRFELTGFSGGNEAAVEEISAMIELAKQGQ